MVATAHPRRPGFSRARRRIAGCLIAATVAATLIAVPAASANGPSCRNVDAVIARSTRAQLQAAVVCLINQQRTERHLPGLIASPRLDDSAQGWTNTMVGRGEFSHGSAFMNRITAVGFDWSNVGENIATGFQTPASVVTAWMASPGHCANILDPEYREVGTGVADRMIPGASNVEGTWTQDFGLLMGQHPLSENFAPAHACSR